MSKMNQIDAYLFCMNCDKETDHEISYYNDQIHRIKCRECNFTVQINQEYVNKHFNEDFVARVLSKPKRMTREMEIDLNGFLKYLPFRVITKPYRMMQEYQQIQDKQKDRKGNK